jgi:Family of unknown function (DUF5985)
MAETIYLLCAVASLACAVLLLRGFSRTGARILLWSSLCFVGLVLNNLLLFVDLVLLPHSDLALARSGAALLGLAPLVFALVWES